MKDQSAVIPLQFESKEIRVLKDEADNPWWVAKDVCDVLEHSNHNVAVKALDDDERGVRKVYPPHMPKGQDVVVISESGLYTLIIRSNKPEAKKFRKWVTGEVLPMIRKTGSYNHHQLATLSPAQQRKIQTLISNKVYSTGAEGSRVGVLFRHIYRMIKDQYQVGSYKDIPQDQFDDLVVTIQKMAIPVPLPSPSPAKQIEGPAPVPATIQAKDWQTAWDILCGTHADLSGMVENLRKDVTAMMPQSHFQPIPKGVDVLEHIHLHYSPMERAARQINVLSELLMWKSPKVAGVNMELGKPRY